MHRLFDDAALLIRPGEPDERLAGRLLAAAGFEDRPKALQRLRGVCGDDEACRAALADSLPMLLAALSDAATPDGSLVNFERFAQSVDDRTALFRYLASHPRAVEILVKLFVGSQFLTEILLRNPGYLERLTQHKRLAEFKSRADFVEEALAAARNQESLDEKLDALRRFQQWELLRIGACDSFGLMDLKSVTVQLSLLADSLVQTCLGLLAEELEVDLDRFVVLAFGKLGGEELNYSSDIDLVFLSGGDATKFWPLGQRLIKSLMQSTGEGFLYRVDMRLRPWGRSGALVNTVEAHLAYLRQHGRPWELQALIKARPIAGDLEAGFEFLRQAEPLVYGQPAALVRRSIREMKARIESDLEKQGRKWGEVKSGEGSIRDVEFVTQGLQLTHGREHPEVRSIGTLDGLVRLADFGLLQADEFRHLSSGYNFLRTIEHALQLMHHKQTHSLPESRREQAWLARRLDYPDRESFLAHYERHCGAIRAIYEKYIEEKHAEPASPTASTAGPPDHRRNMERAYSETFTDEEIAGHAVLLEKLSEENLVEIAAEPAEGGRWRLTVVGYNHTGELSLMCGLLFVYGFNIVSGQIFTAEQMPPRGASLEPAREKEKPRSGRKPGRPLKSDVSAARREFVNVFTLIPPPDGVPGGIWQSYKKDLVELVELLRSGEPREAQGRLARRVATALREVPAASDALLPVEIEIDNEASERCTVLRIRAEDTIGFLYELTNALALWGIEVERVVVDSVGNRVFDTLFITTALGRKITDEARLRELRAAIVLIKHFTHLLPQSPNPEAALLQFREFLEQIFRQPDWLEELASLERTEVLEVLARLLGVSTFLWEDFLRLQHRNLFPVVRDVEGLAQRKTRGQLREELQRELGVVLFDARTDLAIRPTELREKLNAFKDREMFRIDMRHIMGHIEEFGRFSEELTDLADVVVDAAYRICDAQLRARYGTPCVDEAGETPGPAAASSRSRQGLAAVDPEPNSGGPPCGRCPGYRREARARRPCPLAVCALGKCGGRELGFASDIELMFIYEAGGKTTGPEVIGTAEYFVKLVEAFTHTIHARREGIFQVDLRLRPYGSAGPLAVSLEAFRTYFAPDGPAWPYERQALVKLRPIAGDGEFGRRVIAVRDGLTYTGRPFDAAAMKAMREKQLRQLVKAGTFNAKLSPGGLVDIEYLVQGLQLTHGHQDRSLRKRRTLRAMQALRDAGVLGEQEHRDLRAAYVFLRRLIDALRMVRGHAKDLTVPPVDSEEFEYLARRLEYPGDPQRLQEAIERHTRRVQELGRVMSGE